MRRIASGLSRVVFFLDLADVFFAAEVFFEVEAEVFFTGFDSSVVDDVCEAAVRHNEKTQADNSTDRILTT